MVSMLLNLFERHTFKIFSFFRGYKRLGIHIMDKVIYGG